MNLTNKGTNNNYIIVKGLNKQYPELFYIIDKNDDRIPENAVGYAKTKEEAEYICQLQNSIIL